MKRKTVRVFGETSYLLGKGKDGTFYYLVEPTWDCGWYWGLGYVHSYTNNTQPTRSRDISSHKHFNSMFLDKDLYHGFKEFFVETPLADREIWKLLELMQSAYTMRSMADMCCTGGAHITSNPCAELLRDKVMYKRINDVLLPAVFEQVRNLLAGGDNE